MTPKPAESQQGRAVALLVECLPDTQEVFAFILSTSIISALGRQRQEDQEFKASLSCVER